MVRAHADDVRIGGAMSIEDVRTEMRDEFEKVHQRFQKVHQRFEKVDQQFEKVDQQFEKVDQQFEKVDKRFKRVDQQFAKLRSDMWKAFRTVDERFHKLQAEMKAEGERTRRHFDVMVEKMQESVKLVAEATAHHAVRLDDHEKRIKRLEGPRRA
jgi:predicted  nucleic acid-binding Zn-ribbon protein